jgi:hypothetical protein
MARFPGTETHGNRAGLQPGDAVRCRRSAANAGLGLADRRGFLTEVRAGHACVLLEPLGPSVWLENEALLREDLQPDSPLEPLRRACCLVHGQRFEFEQGGVLTIFSSGFPAEQLDALRTELGNRLAGLQVQPAGVHELAVVLRLRT